MTAIEEWLAKRAEVDRTLYEKYGRPLEKSHPGQFVAISDDGETILGSQDVEVLEQAVQHFGTGRFAFRRIGYRAIGRWLLLRK